MFNVGSASFFLYGTVSLIYRYHLHQLSSSKYSTRGDVLRIHCTFRTDYSFQPGKTPQSSGYGQSQENWRWPSPLSISQLIKYTLGDLRYFSDPRYSIAALFRKRQSAKERRTKKRRTGPSFLCFFFNWNNSSTYIHPTQPVTIRVDCVSSSFVFLPSWPVYFCPVFYSISLSIFLTESVTRSIGINRTWSCPRAPKEARSCASTVFSASTADLQLSICRILWANSSRGKICAWLVHLWLHSPWYSHGGTSSFPVTQGASSQLCSEEVRKTIWTALSRVFVDQCKPKVPSARLSDLLRISSILFLARIQQWLYQRLLHKTDFPHQIWAIQARPEGDTNTRSSRTSNFLRSHRCKSSRPSFFPGILTTLQTMDVERQNH